MGILHNKGVRRSGLFPVPHAGAWLVGAVLACGLAAGARGQSPGTNATPTPDPLMTLMLAQPGIDVESPVRPTAVFEPSVVRPGDPANYRVVVNALEAGLVWPQRPPAVAGLTLREGGRGQILQPGGTNLLPRTTFLYRAVAKTPGTYTVPGFTIRAYGRAITVPAATLEVTGALPVPARPQILRLQLASTNLFVGQAARARLTLENDTNGFAQSLAHVRFVGDGFVADQSSVQQRIEPAPNPRGGPPLAVYTYEISLIPIAAGDLSLFAQGYTASSRFSGPIVITGGTVTLAGGPPQFRLLDSDPLQVRVRPLPKAGVLPGFKGAVGSFRIDPPQVSTNVVGVGQPLKLTVAVRGEGNLPRLVPPEPPRVKRWQIFAAPLDPTPSQVQYLQGFTLFSWTLIPLSDELTETPAIPFSYFDPGLEKFVDLTIPSVPLKVTPAPPSDAPLKDDGAPAFPEEVETLQLADLADAPGRTAASLIPVQERVWFPLLQLLPALGFFALVAWDRRRRFHELHPEVLVKRRARRALKRHWGEMARYAAAGRGSRFADAAVRAMQAGCAPFHPANPPALVGGDILLLLPHRWQTDETGQAVRAVFDAVDARRFGDQGVDAMDVILRQRPAIERALAFLDERLRL